MFQTFFCKKALLSTRLSITLIFFMALIACSQGESRVDEALTSRIYHTGNSNEPQDIDPHTTSGVTEQRIQWALFEGLVTMDTKDLSTMPGVAERWEISEDGKIYRFYLRKDARWSNGDPVTSEDFRWSWQRSLSPALGNVSAYMLYPIKNAEPYLKGEIVDFNKVGVRIIDPYTLEVELNNPTSYFLQLLDHHSAAPVHRATIEKFGKATDRFSPWTRPDNIVTNGPFQLKNWAINRYIEVEKNPHYWDQKNVWLEGIFYYPIESYSSSERMFRAGQLHQTYEMPMDKVSVYRENRPEALRVNPYIGSYYYVMNLKRKPFDDVRVRRALAMSIDRDALINSVMNGVNMPSYGIVPPGTLGYQPPDILSYDPEEAKRLLAEAGYPNGKDFPGFELLYNSDETHRKVAVVIQQMWKSKLNIDVQLVNQEWKVYMSSRTQKFFDMVRAGWIGDYVDPQSFIDLWLSDSGNNNSGWNDPEYDRLVKQTIPETKTPKERLAAVYKAETILLNALPFIPIYTYETKYLMHESVKGSYPNLMDKFNYKQIYFEQ